MSKANTIYLDYAAATPLDPVVQAAMQPYLADRFYNPSATYLAARSVADDIAKARAKIAFWLGARSAELVFTAGGTEANNLAIRGVMDRFPNSNLVVSTIEHESVLKPAEQYQRQLAPVQPDGRLDLGQLAKLIDDQTVLVSIMYANNEVGTIQPLKEIAKLLNKIRQSRQAAGNKLPLYLHTDACQAPAYLDLHVHRLGVDLMTLNGGKIYGPKQSGLLFVKAGTTLAPQILGGGQEYGLRSGTENVPAIIGLSVALDLVQKRRQAECARLTKLQKLFYDLVEQELPRAVVNGSRNYRLVNNLHLTLPGEDNERLIIELDQAGIYCAAGSACSASNEEPSHVLKAIGLSQKTAQASLRFSLGRTTTQADIHRLIKTLVSLTSSTQAKAVY